MKDQFKKEETTFIVKTHVIVDSVTCLKAMVESLLIRVNTQTRLRSRQEKGR